MIRTIARIGGGGAAALVLTASMGAPAGAHAQATQLTLHDAVRLSLDTHPRLRAARAGREAAAAALAETRAARIPHAAVEANLIRFQEAMIVAPLHEFDFMMAPQFDRTLIQSRVTAGYTLFDGGAREARVLQSRETEESAAADVVAVRMAVIEEVTVTYLHLLTALGIDDANRGRVAALEAERRRADQLFAQGRAARVEVLRVEAALAQARAELIASGADVDVARGTLARLSGVSPELIANAQLVGLAVDQRSLDQLVPATAHVTTPELERARHRAAAERAAARAARAAWFPTLTLLGGYVTYGSAAGDFSGEWQGGVSLSYPLFTGGARRSRTARAAATAARAEADAGWIQLQLDLAVDQATARVRQSRAQVGALTSAVDHLTEVARIEQLALTAGAGVQVDYIRAEADLATARANLIRARHAEIAARVSLARTLGELSIEWLTAALENQP